MPPVKNLSRSTDNRIVAGVCGGLGEYFDVDPTLVRVAYVVLSFFTVFVGLLLYICLIFIIPASPR